MNRLTRILRLTPLAIALMPAAVWADAASDLADLKSRLAQLEQQVKESKNTLPAMAAPASAVSMGDTKFTFGGYVKLDAMMSRFSAGEVAGNSNARDFYNPTVTPVGTGPSSTVMDMHAKQSRFIFKTETPAGAEGPVRSHIELDFQNPARGTERVTNNYDPGLRQAFVTYGNWLAGQAWSTFQDLGALPETVEFVGAADGTVFARQPQVRYTSGALQIAAENAQTSIGGTTSTTTADCSANPCVAKVTKTYGINDTNDNGMPDLVARYTHKGDYGYLSIAALGRQLKSTDKTKSLSDTATGFGVSLSGKIKIGNSGDDLRLMLTHGTGIGRYVALGISSDATFHDGKLDPIKVTAGYLTYRHLWTDKLRSSFQVSGISIDNPAAVQFGDKAGDVTKTSYSGLTNLIYSVTPKLEVGVEYLHGKREIESGLDGKIDRLQFMAKHSF